MEVITLILDTSEDAPMLDELEGMSATEAKFLLVGAVWSYVPELLACIEWMQQHSTPNLALELEQIRLAMPPAERWRKIAPMMVLAYDNLLGDEGQS